MNRILRITPVVMQDQRNSQLGGETIILALYKVSKHPYVGGDINRDGAYNDFAAIVVDTTRTDPNRFSLVIFSQPTDLSGRYKTHLLFSERDLSKTLLEWWSGGLAVREYHDDGTYDYCVVKSDKAFQTYSCDKEVKSITAERRARNGT